MKRSIKILLILLGGMAAMLLLAICGLNLYFRLSVSDFYSRAAAEGPVPGLSDGFIPQGLAIAPEGDIFLSCGYMNDGSASRIYLYQGDDVRYALLADDAGQSDTSHAGGLACWDEYVFLAHGNHIAVYSLEGVRAAAAQSAAVSPIALFPVSFGAAFCHAEGDLLYVGEFYRETVYPTPEHHHMTTDSGDSHHALLCVYDLTQLKAHDFAPAAPIRAYSIADQAQGMCVTASGRLCVSTSWGLSFSHILVYEDPAQGPADGEIQIGDARTPLYYLDSAHQQEDISLIPMCEELCYLDGRVLFTNESASAKYIFGKFTGGGRIFSLPVE